MTGRHDWYLIHRNPLLLTVLASAAVVLLALFASTSVQFTSLGLLSIAVLHILLSRHRPGNLSSDFAWLQTPMALAPDKPVFQLYQQLCESLELISRHTDPIYRGLALGRVHLLSDQLSEVAQGRIAFSGTETWRTAYAQLLESPGLYQYRSIAHARSCTYWQDEPGRQSIELNYDLLRTGAVRVERIVILPDNLWPAGERFPIEPLNSWLHEQQTHGVQVSLVRKTRTFR